MNSTFKPSCPLSLQSTYYPCVRLSSTAARVVRVCVFLTLLSRHNFAVHKVVMNNGLAVPLHTAAQLSDGYLFDPRSSQAFEYRSRRLLPRAPAHVAKGMTTLLEWCATRARLRTAKLKKHTRTTLAAVLDKRTQG